MANIIWGLVIGLGAGLLSGLFGIGGGIVIVPALILALGFSQHKAQGTSLMALLLPVGLLGVINYFKDKNVDIQAGLAIAAGVFAGAFFGSKFALNLDEVTMRKSFAIFLGIVALYTFFKK